MTLTDLQELMLQRKIWHITVQCPNTDADGRGWKVNLRVNAGWNCGLYRASLEDAVKQVFGTETEVELDLGEL